EALREPRAELELRAAIVAADVPDAGAAVGQHALELVAQVRGRDRVEHRVPEQRDRLAALERAGQPLDEALLVRVAVPADDRGAQADAASGQQGRAELLAAAVRVQRAGRGVLGERLAAVAEHGIGRYEDHPGARRGREQPLHGPAVDLERALGLALTRVERG